MNNIEIYYFSGTGNSLHVAKELQKRIPGTVLKPIVSLLKNDVIKTQGKTVGFVFPIYLTLVPYPVRCLLKKIDLTSADYIFTAATRIGTFTFADIYFRRMLKKKGKKLNSFFLLNMASNSPTGLRPTPGDKNWVNDISKEKIDELEQVVQKELDLIKKAVLNRDNNPVKIPFTPFKNMFEKIMSSLIEVIKTEIKYHADSTCTSCGICERICPSGKIKIVDKKPVWQKNVRCFYCFACFNFCPEQSILVGNIYTEKKGRYHHPDVVLKEIEGQK
ncbi:MAG: EFR1 family ferrodoxin [Spirochaetes bacterium]|nr:EFR1 family ferrodoxin [Spirochaetota bacterium]